MLTVCFTVDYEPDCPPYMRDTFRGVEEGTAPLLAMLREEGFARVEVVHREPVAYRLARAGYRRLRGPRFRAQQGRVVVHAHRR